MQPNTSDNQYSEQTLRQIALDARRALIRGCYSAERAKIENFRCVDAQAETEQAFGRQLWFFDGVAADEADRRRPIYGAVEYSLQYGLYEVVEDGVFVSPEQRNRFRHVYRGYRHRPSWRDPAHRLLLLGLLVTPLAALTYFVLQWIAP